MDRKNTEAQLIQGSPEWLGMRKNYLGASDAPVIMEVSPWKTPFQLWEEKLDLVPSQILTPAMKMGQVLEDKARQELEKMTGLFFLPQVKFHAHIPWMMASLDAIDPESRNIGEIKCVGKVDHAIAQSGQVPEKYFPQLQHQLEVCELEMSYYLSVDITSLQQEESFINSEQSLKGVLLNVYRDDAYIKKMLVKEKEFWERLQNLEPPEMTEKDFHIKTDNDWIAIASEWRSINEQLNLLEKQEKSLRDQLIAMSQKQNAIGAGVRVSRFLRKGSIDYSKIPGLENKHLESFRKKPIECWRVSSTKNKAF